MSSVPFGIKCLLASGIFPIARQKSDWETILSFTWNLKHCQSSRRAAAAARQYLWKDKDEGRNKELLLSAEFRCVWGRVNAWHSCRRQGLSFCFSSIADLFSHCQLLFRKQHQKEISHYRIHVENDVMFISEKGGKAHLKFKYTFGIWYVGSALRLVES